MSIGYKYRANIIEKNNYLRDIDSLLKDELWASSFDDLNDPFETEYIDNISRDLNTLKELFNMNINDVQAKWENLKRIKENLGIYSLSLSEKDYPSSNLMWSHYSNSHKGFCIAYDIDKLKDSEKLPFSVDSVEVKYVENVPKIDVNDITHRIDFIVKMFGTKMKVWQYEKEIRLLYSTFGIKHYSPFALKAVYFGLDMDEQYQSIIIDGLQNRDIKFYKMNRKENSYEILPIFLCENSRKIDDKLPLDLFEVLKTDHNYTVENFHILYKGFLKDEATLQRFSSNFREQYSTKEANIFIYDDKNILDLIGKYPLYGNDQYRLANHLIAMSTFDAPNDIWMYPDKS